MSRVMFCMLILSFCFRRIYGSASEMAMGGAFARLDA
jgi:hypothetical protein